MRPLNAAALGLALMSAILCGGSDAQQAVDAHYHVTARIAQPTRTATLYATGKPITTKWEKVWRPICETPHGSMTRQELLHNANVHELEMLAVDPEPEGGLHLTQGGGGGINIQFNNAASVPAAALAALNAVEAYLESLFDDPITVRVNVSFQALAPGVLGQTGSNYTHVSWTQSRNGLMNGMDNNDEVQTWLPRSSTIPVRYNGNSTTITNENRVFWTLANFRATVGSVSGVAGDLVFNTNFSWDYDPTNGVVGYSFQDVVVHEVGHALGFSSGVDGRINDIEALDIYRFQRTDDGHDYNPDSRSEFRVRPRLASFNSPNGQHLCDLTGGIEYRMCDGMSRQASHFRNKNTSPIGLMDPVLGSGISFHPNFFSPADLNMFDAIGYDR